MVLRFELMPAKYCYNKKWYISSELGKQYNKHFTLKKSHLLKKKIRSKQNYQNFVQILCKYYFSLQFRKIKREM